MARQDAGTPGPAEDAEDQLRLDALRLMRKIEAGLGQRRIIAPLLRWLDKECQLWDIHVVPATVAHQPFTNLDGLNHEL